MTHNIDNTQMLPLSFPDIMTKLYLTWESSEKEKKQLQEEANKYKNNIDKITAYHEELLKNVETLQSMNNEYKKEIVELKKKLEDAEDDQKQFRKVSHILTMDRENSNYKQQIAILERRVTFYKNQCSDLKSSNDVLKIDEQTDTDDLFVDNLSNDNEQSINPSKHKVSDLEVDGYKESDIITYNDDFICNKESDITNCDDNEISVKEKKIKGVVYYLSDTGDIYIKNDDSSIGELKGKLEYLPTGKTKVKWYKIS